MAKDGAKLTLKQQAFVDEYMKDLNATQAAIRAGYSAKTAAEQAARLLTNVKIQSYLQEKQEARSRRTEITADRVLEELGKIAFSDMKAVMQWDESGISLRPMEEVDGTILQEISETETQTDFQTTIKRKVKLYDKLRALELVGKHLGMFTDKVDIRGSLGVTIVDDIGDEDD